jgi:hypothetical protein
MKSYLRGSLSREQCVEGQWVAFCQTFPRTTVPRFPAQEFLETRRSSNNNRRNVLKSLRIRRLIVMCDARLANL